MYYIVGVFTDGTEHGFGSTGDFSKFEIMYDFARRKHDEWMKKGKELSFIYINSISNCENGITERRWYVDGHFEMKRHFPDSYTMVFED